MSNFEALGRLVTCEQVSLYKGSLCGLSMRADGISDDWQCLSQRRLMSFFVDYRSRFSREYDLMLRKAVSARSAAIALQPMHI